MSPEAQLYDPVMELLARYDASSARISIRVVDPVKNLLEAQQLADRFQLTQPDVVVFDAGEDRRVVESVDLAEEWIRRAVYTMDVASHTQQSFLRGVLDTSELVFFGTWTAFFLFLTTRALEARRWRG